LVLGPLELLDGAARVPLGSAKQRLLLATLLVHANTVVSVDRLADILWGDDLPVDAAATLRNHVSRLRAVLEPGQAGGGSGSMLVTRAPGYLLRVEQNQVDASCFERLVAEARVTLREGDPVAAVDRLGEAALPALFRAAESDNDVIRREARWTLVRTLGLHVPDLLSRSGGPTPPAGGRSEAVRGSDRAP